MARVAASIAVALLIMFTGCGGIGGNTSESMSTTATTTTTTSTTTTTDSTWTTTAIEYSCVGDSPPKGSELLSVRQINESEAMEANASQRFMYQNLSEKRKIAFRESLERDCNLVQDAFHYYDGGIYYVQYDEQWYVLRVSIV